MFIFIFKESFEAKVVFKDVTEYAIQLSTEYLKLSDKCSGVKSTTLEHWIKSVE